MCNSNLIASLITRKIRTDPSYKVKHIQSDVQNEYGILVLYRKAWYARQKCIEAEYGKFAESYNELPQFLQSMKVSNPGTIVDVQLDLSNDGDQSCHFLYAFWAFKPALDGFKYCMPVLTVDGTHLYGKYKGHLLLAVGLNANKEIFPLAYSIVDSENAQSWTWFLKKLATHVFPDHHSICIISDRHAGIDAAFRDLPELSSPRVQRRYCLRHIRSNVMTRYRQSGLKSKVWEAGTAVTRAEFTRKMEHIRLNYPQAYSYLHKIEPEKWTYSHDGGHRYGMMTTNSSESFNNSLKGCRMLPVTAIARMTFHKIRTMFNDRRSAGQNMLYAGMRWPKRIEADLLKREKATKNSTVEPYNDQKGLYAVALDTRRATRRALKFFTVCLADRTCECGQNLDGLPCAHIIAACDYRGTAYDSFVANVFSTEYYCKSYEGDFYPPCSHTQWSSSHIVLPPSKARRQTARGPMPTRRYPNEMDVKIRLQRNGVVIVAHGPTLQVSVQF